MAKETKIVRNREELAKVISGLVNLEIIKPIAVIVQDHDIRSIAQNSLLHMWISIMSKETGYTPEEMKVILKKQFLGFNEVINKKTGEVIKELRHTADLKTEEFTKFLNEIENVAITAGISLPHPEDLYYEAMR